MRNVSLENVEEFYPLSPMQQGLLFHSLYAPGTGVYCDQASYSLNGDLDVSAFRRAWQWVVDHHAVLRTAFVWENLKEPIQVVYRKVSLPFEEEDWRELPAVERERRLSAYLRTVRERGFQLSNPPLMRMGLLRLTDDSYHFVWSWHHLLLDGWSFPLVHRELFAIYEAFRLDLDPPLDGRRPFKDYIKWLRQQDLSAAEQYWTKRLTGFTTPTTVSLNRMPDPPTDGGKGYGDQEKRLSAASTAALRAFARRFHLTLNTLVQGAWALMLARYGGEDDVVFGTTVSGRPAALAGVESMVGIFINTLPLRVQVSADDTLVPWLQRLQSEFAELRQYEYTPLVKVQKWSEVPRELFQSLLVFENFPTDTSEALQQGSLDIGKISYVTRINYPLTALVVPGPELSIRLMYERSRFEDSAIARMSGHVCTILEGMIADPNRRAKAVPLLTEAERCQLLDEWNTTSADYPRDRTVAQLFDDQATRTPAAIAVVFGQEALTYGDLNRRANQLAHHLHTLGVRPGVLVGICIERSVDMLVGLLGILKAGGAYMPLDPALPRGRLAFMVADAGLSLIVTQEAWKDVVSDAGAPAVCLDRAQTQIRRQPAEPVGQLAKPDDIAYVIYTSGSTGKPKGVEISHRALTNFLWAMRSAPGCAARDVLLAVTTLSFDIAGLELYLPLIVGGRIEMASREVATDGRLLRERLERGQPTLMQATPATWRMLVDAGWQGTPGLTALCGGEALPRDLAAQLLERTASLWNMYGPTETTIWSSMDRVRPDDAEITIGRPIANTDFYILDKHLQPVPVGVPGELFIGGDGLARGYRNRPDLTAERFIPHPFAGVPDARLYRTGDLARYREDGRVVHLGRLDHQVKVRGFRIELGEIEAALATHEAVSQAIAAVRADGAGGPSLAAYFVPAPGRVAAASELRQHLQRTLPEYMLPQFFVPLSTFPQTPNGKVDRRALASLDVSLSDKQCGGVSPRDILEQQIAQIWEEVLDCSSIGIDDNFFDLGGHSLLAVRMIDRVAQVCGKRLPVSTLFAGSTVRQLASALLEQSRESFTTPLMAVQAGGSRVPFFFLHGDVTGGGFFCRELARQAGPEQPFYVFHPHGLDGRPVPPTFEAMAEENLRTLRAFQRTGPYLLGGFCLGGLVALEMARQLQAAGEEVKLLVVMDGRLPGVRLWWLQLVTKLVAIPCPRSLHVQQNLFLAVRTLYGAAKKQVEACRKDPRDVLRTLYQRVCGYSPPDRSYTSLDDGYRRAFYSYMPQRYSGRVTLFLSDDFSAPHFERRWRQMTRGVEVHRVPGTHFSSVTRHVDVVAARLKTCLDGAQE